MALTKAADKHLRSQQVASQGHIRRAASQGIQEAVNQGTQEVANQGSQVVVNQDIRQVASQDTQEVARQGRQEGVHHDAHVEVAASQAHHTLRVDIQVEPCRRPVELAHQGQ